MAAVLPDQFGAAGAASDHVDEADHSLRSLAVEGLNEALLAKAAEAKLLRCTLVRVDTTVVPSNVAYPTDAGLLAKAVGRIAATGRRIQAAGGATRTQLRDRSRAAGSGRMRSRRSCGRGLRSGGMRPRLR